MDAITAIKNQYLGINAHLHSFFQAKGGWNGFHTLHIGDLAKALKAKLFPMGYTADIESSLQIRRLDKPSQAPEFDVLIQIFYAPKVHHHHRFPQPRHWSCPLLQSYRCHQNQKKNMA